MRRRLGPEFLDYAINPFVGGVYAGSPETLSVSAAFPRLHELEQRHGSLLRGLLFGARERARRPEQSKRSAPMFAFRDGMQTLPDAIARRLQCKEFDTAVTGVTTHVGGFEVAAVTNGARREFSATAIVLAVPAYTGAKLVATLAPEAATALAAIPYPAVVVVYSCYERRAIAHALDGFGVLVPECEHRNTLGTIFSSTLFEDRAASGMVLLTTFIGGTRQPELAALDDEKIAALVHAEHASILGATAPPESVRVRRWPLAIPQYTRGHASRIAQVEKAERDCPGLFLRANYRGGVSVGDCIKSARQAATEVIAFLGSR